MMMLLTLSVLAAIARATEIEPPPGYLLVVQTAPPASSYLPFGIAQLSQHRTGAAVLHGSVQTILGIGSLASYLRLEHLNREGSALDHPSAFQRERYLLQWPLALGFWGSVVASHLDARAHWRRENRFQLVPLLTVGGPVGLSAGGAL